MKYVLRNLPSLKSCFHLFHYLGPYQQPQPLLLLSKRFSHIFENFILVSLLGTSSKLIQRHLAIFFEPWSWILKYKNIRKTAISMLIFIIKMLKHSNVSIILVKIYSLGAHHIIVLTTTLIIIIDNHHLYLLFL